MDVMTAALTIGALAVVPASAGAGLRRRHRDRRCFRAQALAAALLAGAASLTIPAASLGLAGRFAPSWEAFAAGALAAGALALLYRGAWLWQQGGLLRHTPASPLRSAPAGFMRAAGAALPEEGTVRTETGGIACLFFREVTERYERHTERFRDPKTGRERTRVVRRWVHADFSSGSCPFVLDDGTGRCIVMTPEAEVHAAHAAHFYNRRRVDGFPAAARVGDRRTTVRYLPPRAGVTVWGCLAVGGLRRDPFHRCLVVVEGPEARVLWGRSLNGLGAAALGLLAAGAALGLLLDGD